MNHKKLYEEATKQLEKARAELATGEQLFKEQGLAVYETRREVNRLESLAASLKHFVEGTAPFANGGYISWCPGTITLNSSFQVSSDKGDQSFSTR